MEAIPDSVYSEINNPNKLYWAGYIKEGGQVSNIWIVWTSVDFVCGKPEDKIYYGMLQFVKENSLQVYSTTWII